ncbi:hypothetical protein, partial [Mesorhizobium sp.]|uniref:hypothetical protein n=1 Tax=Mesorhizobium sp. TaxID=1871066 RepID=UPI0025BDFA64
GLPTFALSLQGGIHRRDTTLTPAGKRFLAKTYKANPRLFDAQYASEESGLRVDDNGKLMDEPPCEAWYGDYLKGGSSHLGFQPFVEITPE